MINFSIQPTGGKFSSFVSSTILLCAKNGYFAPSGMLYTLSYLVVAVFASMSFTLKVRGEPIEPSRAYLKISSTPLSLIVFVAAVPS